MNLLDKYHTLIVEKNKEIKKIEKVGRIYVALKLIFFALFIFSLYLFFSADETIIYAIITFAIYIFIFKIDNKRDQSEREIREYIKLYNTEIDYLNNNIKDFDGGDRYINHKHNFSFDLDLFGQNSLFSEINRTISTSGADMLAGWLQFPSIDSSKIFKRVESIAELSNKIEWTHKFRVLGRIFPVGDREDGFISRWKSLNYNINLKIRPLLYVANAISLILLSCAVFGVMAYTYFSIMTSLQLIIWVLIMKHVNKAQHEIDTFVKNISNYFHLIDHISKENFKSDEMMEIDRLLSGKVGAVEGFKALKKVQAKLDGRGNVLLTVLLNMCYLSDLHTMITLASWHNKYVNFIEDWITAVDKVDALISLANYKYSHPEYITPIISEESIVKATGLIHPLIKGDYVVDNDIEISGLHKIFIVTGANMSGKSTFLRGVGLNMVLALTGCVVRAKEFEFKPIPLFTSMRTSDNLSKGESYFHAELLRLKSLHDNCSDGSELFVILDEMLKGTNSADKVKGSWLFLEKLRTLNVSGLVATHDLQLGELHEKYSNNFHNICFEIEHCGDELIYSYKLQEGVSQNMNATFLLSKMNLI